MTEESKASEQEEFVANDRPDPLFKSLTEIEVGKVGIEVGPTEAAYSTLADLVLLVPPGVDLEGTPFDFFRAITVLEFKSQHDKLDLEEYVKNEIRSDIQYLRRKPASYSSILNLIVTSRFPAFFLKEAAAEGLVFQQSQERRWLWQTQAGLQTVLIVVCRDLPLEEPLHPWLVFAPTDSQKWADFLGKIFREKRQDFLQKVSAIRPKEYEEMEKKLENEELNLFAYIREKGTLTPDEKAYILSEQLAVLKDVVQNAHEWSPNRRRTLPQVLAMLTPEQRLAGMKPEERLEGLNQTELEELEKFIQLRQKRAKQDKAQESD